jgi:hypothetical protein
MFRRKIITINYYFVGLPAVCRGCGGLLLADRTIELKMKGGRLTTVQWDTINFDELHEAGLAAVQEQRYRPGTAARSNEAFRAYKTFMTNCPSALEKNDGTLLPILEHMRSFLTFVRTVLVSLHFRLI